VVVDLFSINFVHYGLPKDKLVLTSDFFFLASQLSGEVMVMDSVESQGNGFLDAVNLPSVVGDPVSDHVENKVIVPEALGVVVLTKIVVDKNLIALLNLRDEYFLRQINPFKNNL